MQVIMRCCIIKVWAWVIIGKEGVIMGRSWVLLNGVSYRLGASYYGVGTDYEMGLVYIR